MKLQNMKEIKGTVILKSGLHIGAGDMELKIGGNRQLRRQTSPHTGTVYSGFFHQRESEIPAGIEKRPDGPKRR